MKEILGILAYAFEETNATTDALRRYFPETKGASVAEKVPFSSSRKHMRVTIAGKGDYRLGAPEYLTENGKILARAKVYAARECVSSF